MKRIVFLLLSLLLCTLSHFPALADDDKDHYHHEDLTGGATRDRRLPSLLGAPAVQKPFERGEWLRPDSFWYQEAQKEFMKIAPRTIRVAPWRTGQQPISPCGISSGTIPMPR